ncbi:hypothetical protein [Lysinibacillus fusiformis]|uniref:hypothetical protein n=1 Tax=Lysinibacillus fusiformis TaxID=28031 RepID=UPI0037FA08DE
MLDSNPNWLAHCTEIKDLAQSLYQKSTIHLQPMVKPPLLLKKHRIFISKLQFSV